MFYQLPGFLWKRDGRAGIIGRAVMAMGHGVLLIRRRLKLSSTHSEIGKFGGDQGAAKNLTTGIWLIFRGLNFSRNADIGQIGHLWMGTM
jgi:hypothetical protein